MTRRGTQAQAVYQKYSDGSACEIELTARNKAVHRVQINFSGPISAIPSLKNSKLPGHNFLSPSVTTRLQIMDALFFGALNKSGFSGRLSFGAQPVGVVCVCAKRKVRFDTDNVFATVRDWLEPQTKQVGRCRERGWGIGLIENDVQVRGFAILDTDIGLLLNKTIIVIQPYEEMRANLRMFVHEVFFAAMNDGGKWLEN